MPGERSLEIALKSSAEQLTPEARQMWAALCVLPTRQHSFSEKAALVVSGQGVEQLDALSDAGVLEAVGAGRYTFHQVLADYGYAQLSEQEKQNALGRLIDYSLQYTEEHIEHYPALEQRE